MTPDFIVNPCPDGYVLADPVCVPESVGAWLCVAMLVVWIFVLVFGRDRNG